MKWSLLMAKSSNKRFTRTSATNVFVGGDSFRDKVSWRLDVGRSVDLDSGKVDSNFYFKRRGRQASSYKNRLFHYISAGGMGQLKRTTVDDLIEYRRRRFLFFMVLLSIFWLVFYLLPSV